MRPGTMRIPRFILPCFLIASAISAQAPQAIRLALGSADWPSNPGAATITSEKMAKRISPPRAWDKTLPRRLAEFSRPALPKVALVTR